MANPARTQPNALTAEGGAKSAQPTQARSKHSLFGFRRPKSTPSLQEEALNATLKSYPNIDSSHNNNSDTESSMSSYNTNSANPIAHTSESSITSTPKHKSKTRSKFSAFTRHVSMTPFDKTSPSTSQGDEKSNENKNSTGYYANSEASKSQSSIMTSSSTRSSTSSKGQGVRKLSAKSFAEQVKEAHKRDTERWLLSKQLNAKAAPSDPLTYSSARLDLLLELYDSVLRGEDLSSMTSKMDLLEFWSISALKAISGVNNLVTEDILTEFQNYDLKKKEKVKILKLHDPYYGIQWHWQLALDNPNASIFNYSLTPILYTVYSPMDHRKIGPTNFHVVHGKSFQELPFSKNSFSLVLAYSLFYFLKEDEWAPVLSELYRVTQPNGTINLFLLDLNTINCTNKVYQEYIDKIRLLLESKGIDHSPCNKAQARLKDAGFQQVKYSLVALRKGLPTNLGSMMDFLVTYFEFILYTKIGSTSVDDETLQAFKELKLEYNSKLRNGEAMDELGDVYMMFIFGKKVLY